MKCVGVGTWLCACVKGDVLFCVMVVCAGALGCLMFGYWFMKVKLRACESWVCVCVHGGVVVLCGCVGAWMCS